MRYAARQAHAVPGLGRQIAEALRWSAEETRPKDFLPQLAGRPCVANNPGVKGRAASTCAVI